MMRALFLVLALCACSRGALVVEKPPVIVRTPVTVPCVSGARPDSVASLKTQHPDWTSYSVKQKTELVAAQALKLRSYGEGVNASTSACR